MTGPASASASGASLRKLLFLSAVWAGLWSFPGSVKGQTPVDRITGTIDNGVRVRRPGSHPFARPEFDLGRVAGATRMDRMMLVLQADADQQQKLEQLLTAQQDSNSPSYRRWLSPEDFGRQFGVSDHDLNQVVRWLQDQGFAVEAVADGRRQVIFSGTASQVESAFQTEIHEYRVNGAIHHANASDVQIPAALAPVVAGVVSLHDFRTKPMHARFQPAASAPDYTGGSTHYIVPGDFATIYDVNPLYGSSTNGGGQSISIAARSNLVLADIQTFRSKFALPASDPTIIVNGSDPGVLSSDEQGEVELDTEWSGAVAPAASIQVVVSASTQTTDGVTLSSQYIVDHNIAPIVSVSFGTCESGMSGTENQFWNSLWQQAAAQGMTVLVASGDSGADGCDDPSSTTGSGSSVNGLCSSPYSTCVGGTQLNDLSNPAAYWSSTNSSTRASAQSYIPEIAWNESGSNGGTGLWASGGGPSAMYGKPSWQTGRGVPSDGHRDVPDVALAAAAHDGYLFYLNGSYYGGSGTSLATPSFAGLMALIDGRFGARQGNANPSLYALATKQAKGGAAVFHDVTQGNNSVPGVPGYYAAAGYDLVTGLGSVDANQLLNAWNGGSAPPPPPCTYSLAASNAAADATAQILTVILTASSNTCAWIVTSDSSWLTLAGAASGTGSQVITVALAANPSSAPRTGTLTVAGLAFTVAQAGAACVYTLTAGPLRSGTSGFHGSILVSAPAGCAWTAASNVSWVAITSGAQGNGNGIVTLTSAANPGSARKGTLEVAGYSLTVIEAASGKLGLARPPVPKTTPE
jgi:pseudomonalisin